MTGSKSYGYDANGVPLSVTTNGQTLYLTPDAEDRYTRFDFNTWPGRGSVYAAAYNGIGARFSRLDVQGPVVCPAAITAYRRRRRRRPAPV